MTWREEQIGDARLILGDCREVLPTLGKVDAVVTSPPYNTLHHSAGGSGMHRGNRWVNKSANGYADDMPEDEYQDWLRGILDICQSRCLGLIWLNHKIRYRDREGIHPIRMLHYPLYSEIVWDRGGSMTLNAKRFAPSHEGIWGFGKPHYWNDKLNTEMSVWRIAPQVSAEHPCPYPERLIAPLIDASVPPRGCALDPFMGSGTTGVACANLGRKFIGIEIEPKYFDIACKRIDEAYKQGDLFVEKPKPVKQEALL